MKISILLVSLLVINMAFALPENWEQLQACEKQDHLWQQVERTKHRTLPPMEKFGLFEIYKMSKQQLNPKISLNSDVSPKGWVKYIHSRGAIAKVKIVPTNDHSFTGVFKGASCALLRLSLTYKPYAGLGIDKAVAPGLALKVLRDGVHSANISALYSLDGQANDHNFFKNPLSNIVPLGSGIGSKMVRKVFKKYTSYPEQISLTDMAEFDVLGNKEALKTPRQIFFVPVEGNTVFSSEPHDVRDDFLRIQKGTKLYDVYALPSSYSSKNYSTYKIEEIDDLIKKSQPIASIVTDSPFLASQFGDHGIFFKHQRHIR
jgi:hypothetical protein